MRARIATTFLMSMVPNWLQGYRTLPRAVVTFACGQFLINLINSAHFLLLNLYLKDRGLGDPAIAALTSHRFLATFLLAVPAGLWLRGRPLRRPLLLASLTFPLTALAALETVRLGWVEAAPACFLLMGMSGLVLNVASLPMMLRLAPEGRSSEALSLGFATWAAASICAGVLSSGLQHLGAHLGPIHVGGASLILDEHATLLLLTLMGLCSPLLYWRLPNPVPEQKPGHWLHIHREDWPVLGRALLPTICIATGAGLSIQFLNLFFSNVYGLKAADYAAFGSVSYVLVLFAGLSVPAVRRRLGWRGAIIGVQTSAAIVLAVMGLTELWKEAAWALPLALGCFLLRQPLMNMAGPSTSELTMTYVGERNRELMSAINGAIWSGAWWLAARIFKVMRDHDQPYWIVFLATFTLYLFGTFLYLGLIREVERRHTENAAPAPSENEIA